MKKVCDVCGTKLELVEDLTTNVVFGNTVQYKRKRLICKNCNKEIYDRDIFNQNVEATNESLRKQSGLITTSEIKEIGKKYNIGNKPLSLILGFGEIQIDRYVKSGNPSREHSEIMKNVLNNPFVFEMYLRSNKNKISDSVYKRSLSKVIQLEMINDNSKIYSVAEYILKKSEDITNMSIQKILFFVNGFAPKFLGYKLFDDNCEAWIHGPVYKDIYLAFCTYYKNIIDINEIISDDDIALTEEEKTYLDKILPFFNNYSGSALRNMSHKTMPWKNAREGLSDEEYTDRIIEKKDISLYFESIINKYKINDINDIKKYSNDLFHEATMI